MLGSPAQAEEPVLDSRDPAPAQLGEGRSRDRQTFTPRRSSALIWAIVPIAAAAVAWSLDGERFVSPPHYLLGDIAHSVPRSQRRPTNMVQMPPAEKTSR